MCVRMVLLQSGRYLPNTNRHHRHRKIHADADTGRRDRGIEASAGFHGCRIDSISYDDKQSKALLALEQSAAQEGGSSSVSTAIEQHGINNVIMLTSDFTCAGSISLPHGKTTGWGLWYAWNPQSTDAHNGWTFIDEGY